MAAGKQGSVGAWLFVDGYDFRAHKIKSLSHKIESITESDMGLGDDHESHRPVGVKRITIQADGGFYDTATGSSHDALAGKLPSGPQATPRVLCCGFDGMAIGAHFYGAEGLHTVAYEVLAQLGQLTKANAQHVVTGRVDKGVILQDLAAKTASWNTKTLGASVDFAADTLQRVIPIVSNTKAADSVVTTAVPHGLTTGQVIVIADVADSSPTINGQRTVTVINDTSFTVGVDTSAGSAGTGGYVILGSTVKGGVGYLQVKSVSGSVTNFVAKIRDSADDNTYADLVTFTDNVAAPFAERKEVSGTIDRYLSVDGAITGTGEVVVFVGFARNL